MAAAATATAGGGGAYVADGGSLGVVEERDEIIGWVRDDCAEDTGDVAAGKAYAELELLAALVLGLGDGVLVDHLHHSLKGRKLHHCI